MRIAFVGKGGSGKTTLSALFAQYMRGKKSVLVIDADLNMHLSSLLGFQGKTLANINISNSIIAEDIKKYLKGSNRRIKDLKHFKKTTPPGNGSNFIILHELHNRVLNQYSLGDRDLRLMVVGTYADDGIGTSCYHNNLAILENVLSHLIDIRGMVVVDMVAGIDAFANTLYSQFDMLAIVVEPTKKSVEVYKQYDKLANEAGIQNSLFVVGNKVRDEGEREYINKFVAKDKILGFLEDSKYLRKNDRDGGLLDMQELEVSNVAVLEKISERLLMIKSDYIARLNRLYDLHRRYVLQDYVRERFGDLTSQIDPDFNILEVTKKYE